MKRPAISAVGPTASTTDPDVLAPHERTRVRRLLNQARHLVLIAVFGLSATMIAAFAWSVAKSVRLIVDLITGGWRNDVKVIEILEVTDSYLLAVVLLIVVLIVVIGQADGRADFHCRGCSIDRRAQCVPIPVTRTQARPASSTTARRA